MIKPLTRRQQDVFDYICQYERKHLRMPTFREIAGSLKLASHNSVTEHLKAIEAAGWLTVSRGKHRGIQIVNRQDEDQIPIYGKVAAGLPIDIAANVERMVTIPDGLFRVMPDFLLTVSGDSMVDIGIYDGDLAGIKRTRSPQSGQIVVAMVDTDEMSREERKECGLSNTGITLKRLVVSGSKLLLKSENREKNYAPLVVRPERVRIEGRFVALVRGG